MQRVVSIWLPSWRTDRIEERAKGGIRLHEPEPRPLAVIAPGKGGKRIVALNMCARSAGLRTDMLLTDACAMLPSLTAVPHEPEAEQRDLKRLAAVCNRFSPWTAPDGPDGLWIEATGVAHLFGGEEALLDRILHYLFALGFEARGSIAGTAGAVWGLARFSKMPAVVVPPGEEAHALASLPVRALRIDDEGAALLERLGLKTLHQLFQIPRSSLKARLGKPIACRLDQALGFEGEALSPLMPEPVYAARLEFADSLTAFEGLQETAKLLIADVTASLKADGKGARRFTLALFDTQNGKAEIRFRMARPTAEAKHIARVLKEKLSALEGRFDPALGFDAVALYALGAEPLVSTQIDILGSVLERGDNKERIAQFLDRVSARLGEQAAQRFAFAESHWPERASLHVPATAHAQARLSARPEPSALPRPLTLLPRPEPIGVTAMVPDHPPRQFTWRRCRHKVERAEGPERISPEWWQDDEGAKTPPARDYYIVEDENGQRFWLYREGIYDRHENQRWFLHGLFP
jgi:protein ImuB